MIPAGSLKYTLTFFQIIELQSESGFVTKTKSELLICKAAKLKSIGNLDENGKELFHTNVLNFKIRNNKLINENLIVNFENKEYKITFIDVDKYDNSTTITIEKINI